LRLPMYVGGLIASIVSLLSIQFFMSLSKQSLQSA
jgi:hypothetical protein